jgi:hypothetical protein
MVHAMDFHNTHSEGHNKHSVKWQQGMCVLKLSTNTSDSVKLRPLQCATVQEYAYEQCVL